MKKLIFALSLYFTVSAFSQDDKTVTLVVSGQGKTQDEAKQNALRSAIEQAFGTFISSKTEILNDNLVKDEIVSISNGNIQKFDIISEVQIPDGGYATTLKATVSVTKLTSFVESKGMVADLKSDLFVANVKQQILNEESEKKSIKILVDFFFLNMHSAFDYGLKVNEPKSNDELNENWKLKLTVEVFTNKNIEILSDYLLNTLDALKMIPQDIDNYNKLGKKYYSLIIRYNRKDYIFNLRNPKSIEYIDKMFEWDSFIGRFSVFEESLTQSSLSFDKKNAYIRKGNVLPKNGILVGLFHTEVVKPLKELEKIKGYIVKPLK